MCTIVRGRERARGGKYVFLGGERVGIFGKFFFGAREREEMV
jgi:hypothetical protein